MAINSSSYARLMFPGVKTIFELGYKDFQTQYTNLFQVEKSNQSYEIGVGSVGLGLAPAKPEGQAVQYDSMQQGFESRFTNVTYALGYQITREAYEDNLYTKQIKAWSSALARSMRQTKEHVAANVYNRAFNASYTGGDGISLISTAHNLKSGGTASNRLATDADVSEASLEASITAIRGFTDDRGLKIQATPMSLHVHPENEFEVARILQSVLQNDTANNAINAIRARGSFKKGYFINDYFTDPDAFFIRTDVPESMMFYDRQPAKMEMDNDTDTFNAKYLCSERYVAGWLDWRGIFGTPGV